MTSKKKIESNRRNSLAGGKATKDRFAEEYAKNPSLCNNCEEVLPQSKRRNKFCSQTCAAKYNNRVSPKRQKAPRALCESCGEAEVKKQHSKYCSTECSGKAQQRYMSDEERAEAKRQRNKRGQAVYRAKHGFLRAYAPNADREKIKEIYDNCPEGYEVDHIIPLSKGGLHHEDNLQYLTIEENRRKGNKLFL